MKQLPKNRVIVASAGSRKTTHLVEEALLRTTKRILVTTFTNENLDQLRTYFISRHGCVPRNVTLITWYAFLLQECARPYQRTLTAGPRIKSIFFDALPKAVTRVKKVKADQYYLTRTRDLYRDRAAEFVCAVDDESGGHVIGRLERIFDCAFIDEVQDLASYDLDLLDKLFASKIEVVCVGDPRQATFSTNRGLKNKKYAGGAGFMKWLKEPVRAKHLVIEERTQSFRCNQQICDFADQLYPDLPKTESVEVVATLHDGIFFVPEGEVREYVKAYEPVVLRYDKRAKTLGLRAHNFGASKGRTYDRVLIFPTTPMNKYLATKNLAGAGDVSKFYVAVTRARYSVAFVTSVPSSAPAPKPPSDDPADHDCL